MASSVKGALQRVYKEYTSDNTASTPTIESPITNIALAALSTLPTPNIVVILTDQERYPAHWPKGWEEQNLPATQRLKRHGLTFKHAYTASCQCTPSRAVLTTSEYFPTNKAPTPPPSNNPLPSAAELTDIGSLLANHTNYEVAWKGKWHLSAPLKGDLLWTEEDITEIEKRYHMPGWNPPDAGNTMTKNFPNSDGSFLDGLTTLGGGWANNDGRFLEGCSPDNPKQTQGFGESILQFIQRVVDTPLEERKPFCLFISFVNPHDIWVYPEWDRQAGYNREDFDNLGIQLPENYHDDLTTKPSVQLKVREAFEKQFPLQKGAEEIGYINFYAYLNKLVDSHLGAVLDALDKGGLTDSTLIFRTADHGELGLSHGMREKAYNIYEETIRIPFIISNPQLFPEPQSTDSFYCHLDLLPTIVELAKVPNSSQYGKGVSIVPTIRNPATLTRDSIMFTYDDVSYLPKDVPGGHIRAIREGNWTYGVYYSEDNSHFEYEMYNLEQDPGQLVNLLHQNISPEIATEANRLHKKLKEEIDRTNALPDGVVWPLNPF